MLNKLNQTSQYTKDDINKAAIIMHPNAKGYNITTEEIGCLFEEGSNFTPLLHPIIDRFGNKFRDSEGYYMAQRTRNKGIKSAIALLSLGHGLARKSRDLFPLEDDETKRIKYMKKAIKEKFDNNPNLKEKLIATGDKTIIEYTYRGDIFFGIDQNTLQGKNVLGKLLMQYRDKNLTK